MRLLASASNLPYTAGYSGFSPFIFLLKQVKETRDLLSTLGARLRAARLARNDTMATFAERLGVSERTVRAMEQGLPTVQLGTWLDALWILDATQPLERLLEPRESLLDRARAQTLSRQRASRRRRV